MPSFWSPTATRRSGWSREAPAPDIVRTRPRHSDHAERAVTGRHNRAVRTIRKGGAEHTHGCHDGTDCRSLAALHLTYTVLFYDLFRPVSRSVSLLVAFFSVVACAPQALAALFQRAALLVVGGGSSVRAFAGERPCAEDGRCLHQRQATGNVATFFAPALLCHAPAT